MYQDNISIKKIKNELLKLYHKRRIRLTTIGQHKIPVKI